MYLKHVITAGILSAALAIGPGAAFAQTSGSTSGSSSTSSQGSSSQSSTSSPSSQGSQSGTTTSTTSSAQHQSGSGGSGADQEAVRQHLSAAREALAEVTKLPAASQLQGEQRQQVAQLISDFNAFATATTDWRPKYDTIDHELDQILGVDASGSASGAASGSASAAGASGSASAPTGTTADTSSAAPNAPGSGGTAGAGGALDPTILAKLREVRTHLDGFEEASGDPTFVVEKIEKILDQAAGGASASGAVGTSGSTDSASAGGSVTLSAAQVKELRRQLETIKAAAKR